MCIAPGKERKGSEEKEVGGGTRQAQHSQVREGSPEEGWWRGLGGPEMSSGACKPLIVHTHSPARPSGESSGSPRNKLKNISKAYLISDVAFKYSLQTPGRSLKWPRILWGPSQGHAVLCTTGQVWPSAAGASPEPGGRSTTVGTGRTRPGKLVSGRDGGPWLCPHHTWGGRLVHESLHWGQLWCAQKTAQPGFCCFWKHAVSWALRSWECRTLYKLPTIHTALTLMKPIPSHTYLNFKGLGRGDRPQEASPCLSESVAREVLFLASHGAFYCSRMLKKKKNREIRITVF